MVFLDIDSIIPEDHFLRWIKKYINFDFIYEKTASYYSHVGRKSINSVVLIKMLLIGDLYGIRLERRLEEEVSLNLAHLLARLGWFCPVASELVKPYFTRFLRVLTFCLGASKIVVFCENGIVNGVVKKIGWYLIIKYNSQIAKIILT